jgi:ABC-type polar amino acid transport system ATPase subunit/GNAT superfamily N-acetyltransferase
VPRVDVVRSSPIERTPRVMQLEGLFDVPPTQRSEERWSATLPIEERDWSIGAIVGPSGAGKSTIARELFGPSVVSGYDWPKGKSLVDGFPRTTGIKEITTLLSSVGFSSPPAWLRPFDVLSTGQQFRVTLARALADKGDVVVMDEFTSVVDRTVAQIGSAAVAKSVRRSGKKFVAVSCHYDVIDWLQPDWVFEPHLSRFQWRELQRRPPIDLVIQRIPRTAWQQFSHHHYLTADLSKSSWCFGAFWRGELVAFDAWLPFVGRLKTSQKARRGHRTVCLPDYQGVGIGNALFTTVARMWKGLGFRAFSGTGHPAEIAHRMRSPDWRLTAAPRRTAIDVGKKRNSSLSRNRSTDRMMASFEFIGAALDRPEAALLLETWARG